MLACTCAYIQAGHLKLGNAQSQHVNICEVHMALASFEVCLQLGTAST